MQPSICRSKLYVMSVFVAVLSLFSAFALTTPSAKAAPVAVIAQGRRDLPKIALTFDDGPNPPYTSQIITILQQHKVPATFFAIGSQVQAHPDLIQEEHTAGYVVGDHTWDHPDLTRLTAAQQVSEVTRTSVAIKQAIGVAPTLVRPPYGALNDTLKGQMAQSNLPLVLWDIDTVDWKRPGTPAITNEVLSHAHNGAIILMHDGGGDRSQTVAALPQIIDALKQRGYQLVTVPQLLTDMQGMA